MTRSLFALEPPVRLSDVALGRAASWEHADTVASRVLGADVLVVPSVRVALVWVLEFLGYRRHTDHVFVPRFVGRCILNSLNRCALPVEAVTPQTRAAVLVEQWGARRTSASLADGVVRIEDSPCGIGEVVEPAPGSIARVIGLAKALPIVQGALLTTVHADLRTFVERRRARSSRWADVVWGTVFRYRRPFILHGYSPLLNAAYEMYPDAGGGSRLIRSNVVSVLARMEEFEEAYTKRVALLRLLDRDRILVPDTNRVGYVAPYLVRDDEAMVRARMETLGFSGQVYHASITDAHGTVHHAPAVLIPLQPRVPFDRFSQLVEGLGAAHRDD